MSIKLKIGFFNIHLNLKLVKFQLSLSLTLYHNSLLGAQWLSGRVLDSRPRGREFEPHWHHCVVFLSKAH